MKNAVMTRSSGRRSLRRSVRVVLTLAAQALGLRVIIRLDVETRDARIKAR